MSDLEYKEFFSNRIKYILEKYDLNQQQLAERLNVSESTVGKWILKKAVPRFEVIQLLSEQFNVPKSFFLDETIEEHDYDPDALEILEMLEKDQDLKMLFLKTGKLSDIDKERLVRILKATLPPEDDQ